MTITAAWQRKKARIYIVANYLSGDSFNWLST